jgi:hypothetical protein
MTSLGFGISIVNLAARTGNQAGTGLVIVRGKDCWSLVTTRFPTHVPY